MIRLSWICLTVFVFPLLSIADELKLSSVIESVRENHPLLLATLEELRSAEGELLAARGAFDPSVKLESSTRGTGYYEGTRLAGSLEQPLEFFGSRIFAGYRRSDGKIPIYEGQFETLNGGELNAGFEVPLLRDGPIDRRRALIQRFQVQGDIASASVEERLILLIRGASALYWDWVSAGEKKRIYAELLKVAEERNNQLTERVKHGDLPQFDLLDNERQVLQRRAQLIQADRLLQSAAFELSLFLRDSSGVQIIPAESALPKGFGTLPPFPKESEEQSIEEAFRRRPELVRLDGQTRQNEIERTLQENQMLPKIDLSVIASQDNGSGSTTLEEGEVKAGVKMELPLRVRTAEGRLQVAEAKMRELSRLVQFQKQRIATDVRDSLNALRLVRDRYLLAKKEIAAARSLEQGERERFHLGDSNLIFVNLREQTAAEASIREVEAAQEYQKALAGYRAVLGLKAEEVLAQLR